jgi:hypothetical protein
MGWLSTQVEQIQTRGGCTALWAYPPANLLTVIFGAIRTRFETENLVMAAAITGSDDARPCRDDARRCGQTGVHCVGLTLHCTWS